MHYIQQERTPIETQLLCIFSSFFHKTYFNTPFFFLIILQSSTKVVSSGLVHLGNFLATLMPRCNDSSVDIRLTAMENVQALLCILGRVNVSTLNDDVVVSECGGSVSTSL